MAKKKKDEAINSSSINNINKMLQNAEGKKETKEEVKEETKEQRKEGTDEGLNKETKEAKNTPAIGGENGFASKNIDFGHYNNMVYTDDFKEDIRRTYKIKNKHVNILNLIKLLEQGRVDFRELVMESIEFLWNEKYSFIK